MIVTYIDIVGQAGVFSLKNIIWLYPLRAVVLLVHVEEDAHFELIRLAFAAAAAAVLRCRRLTLVQQFHLHGNGVVLHVEAKTVTLLVGLAE